MRQGAIIEKAGIYKCLFHKKNKQKFAKGTVLPRCDFAGVKCPGEWHLVKEIKEKTAEEKQAANNHRRALLDKRRQFDSEIVRRVKQERDADWWKDRW